MFKIARFVLFVLLLCVFAASSASAQVEFPEPGEGDLVAMLIDGEGQEIGMALITEMEDMDMENVLLVGVLVWSAMEPGFHALHIHSIGTCDHAMEAPFSSASGHFNPGGATHGTHAGDLPSLYALTGGGGGMMYITDAFTMDSLMDEDGSAFMIHAGRDNFGNIPERYGGPDADSLGAGDAGPRVACGVLEVVE
jgi:Cu-Zn family superoxide dismutase